MNQLPQRKSTRLKEYDYSLNNYYFITICIEDRKEFLSEIKNEKNVLTKYGEIINQTLNNLSKFYPYELDEFVIMPDHIHAIIILDNKNNSSRKSLSTIVQRFKTFTTKNINKILDEENKFKWQKTFYDRIIRNERELYQIRNYIRSNPLKWELEKDLPENLDL
ncbi:MAG: transposase [Ignavibacteriaceae bacterium]|nr:transposase [Ignavibacteriaceae bacterium]